MAQLSDPKNEPLAEMLLWQRSAQASRAKKRWLWFGAAATVFLVLSVVVPWWVMIRMPGERMTAPLPEMTDEQSVLQDRLEADIEMFAITIGERNISNGYQELLAAARFIETDLKASGYQVERQEVVESRTGSPSDNLIVEIPGTDLADEIIVVCAHYDSAEETPGANDNATGVAALLAIARDMKGKQFRRTIRLVAVTNEEPPYFRTEDMGSLVYAKACSERGDNIIAAISLETMGSFYDEPDSQHYPSPLNTMYPSEGNFIGVVGNVASRDLVHGLVGSMRKTAVIPVEGGALADSFGAIGLSDHWAFWKFGYPAVMITDTAPFRYPYYHTPEDTPDKVDFDRFARSVVAVRVALAELADAK